MGAKRGKKIMIAIPALILLSLLAVFMGVCMGATGLKLSELGILFDAGNQSATRSILLMVRLPRALLSYLVGGGLAIAGCCLQGIFKNPMADAHILGVSSGAGFGAAVAISFGLTQTALGLGPIAFFAFWGGIACVALVYSVSRVRSRTSVAALLLAGIATSTLFSALTSGIMILNRDKMEQVLLWTMGSFSAASYTQTLFALATVVPASLALLPFSRPLNIMLLGEEDARMLGVNTKRVTTILMVLTTVIAASCVSVSGIIGFVGLMVPHMIRFLVGSDHKLLLPCSFLGGGVFLCCADMIARSVMPPMEIPVGVISALFGVPFFLFLLRRQNKGGS